MSISRAVTTSGWKNSQVAARAAGATAAALGAGDRQGRGQRRPAPAGRPSRPAVAALVHPEQVRDAADRRAEHRPAGGQRLQDHRRQHVVPGRRGHDHDGRGAARAVHPGPVQRRRGRSTSARSAAACSASGRSSPSPAIRSGPSAPSGCRRQASSSSARPFSGESRAAYRKPSPSGAGSPGSGSAVGLDHDPLVRNAVVAQVVGDPVGQRDEPVHRLPGRPVHRQRGRHQRALRRRAAVALVPHRRPAERLAPAVVAVVAVAEIEPGRADLPVVVHGLHHRHAVRVRGADHPGREQRVRVVQVQHVRPVLARAARPGRAGPPGRRSARSAAAPSAPPAARRSSRSCAGTAAPRRPAARQLGDLRCRR